MSATELLEYAGGLVTQIRAEGIKATTDIRNVSLPGVLVHPLPARTYDLLSEGSFSAEWTIVALAPGPGDLADAKVLQDYADRLVQLFPQIKSVEPASYVLPSFPEPKPALLCKFDSEVTP